MNKYELDHLYQIFETPEDKMRKRWRRAVVMNVLGMVITGIVHLLTEIPGTGIIFIILSFTTIFATAGFVMTRME